MFDNQHELLSMVPTKILHGRQRTSQFKQQWRKYLEDSLRNSANPTHKLDNHSMDSTPLLVWAMSQLDPNNVTTKSFGTTFRYVNAAWKSILYVRDDTTNEPSYKMIVEWQMELLGKKKILRYLYGIWDYSVIWHSKNKMEWVTANTKVIVYSDSYQLMAQNPNHIMDQSLDKRGYILTRDDFEDSNLGTRFKEDSQRKAPLISDADRTTLYQEYNNYQYANEHDRLVHEQLPHTWIGNIIAMMNPEYDFDHLIGGISRGVGQYDRSEYTKKILNSAKINTQKVKEFKNHYPDTSLTDLQLEELIETAHLIWLWQKGKDWRPAWLYNYTKAQLRKKLTVLLDWGLTSEQASRLIRNWYCGERAWSWWNWSVQVENLRIHGEDKRVAVKTFVDWFTDQEADEIQRMYTKVKEAWVPTLEFLFVHSNKKSSTAEYIPGAFSIGNESPGLQAFEQRGLTQEHLVDIITQATTIEETLNDKWLYIEDDAYFLVYDGNTDSYRVIIGDFDTVSEVKSRSLTKASVILNNDLKRYVVDDNQYDENLDTIATRDIDQIASDLYQHTTQPSSPTIVDPYNDLSAAEQKKLKENWSKMISTKIKELWLREQVTIDWVLTPVGREVARRIDFAHRIWKWFGRFTDTDYRKKIRLLRTWHAIHDPTRPVSDVERHANEIMTKDVVKNALDNWYCAETPNDTDIVQLDDQSDSVLLLSKSVLLPIRQVDGYSKDFTEDIKNKVQFNDVWNMELFSWSFATAIFLMITPQDVESSSSIKKFLDVFSKHLYHLQNDQKQKLANLIEKHTNSIVRNDQNVPIHKKKLDTFKETFASYPTLLKLLELHPYLLDHHNTFERRIKEDLDGFVSIGEWMKWLVIWWTKQWKLHEQISIVKFSKVDWWLITEKQNHSIMEWLYNDYIKNNRDADIVFPYINNLVTTNNALSMKYIPWCSMHSCHLIQKLRDNIYSDVGTSLIDKQDDKEVGKIIARLSELWDDYIASADNKEILSNLTDADILNLAYAYNINPNYIDMTRLYYGDNIGHFEDVAFVAENVYWISLSAQDLKEEYDRFSTYLNDEWIDYADEHLWNRVVTFKKWTASIWFIDFWIVYFKNWKREELLERYDIE